MSLRAASLGIFLLIFLPFITSAATIAELQAQLQVLMAQLAALQTQTTAPALPVMSGTSCPNLSRNLSRDMRGSDVTLLQQFLISQKLLSADSATGFFGAMTESALKQWQAANGIASNGTPNTTGYGAVGPRTRAALAKCITNVTASTPAVPNTPAAPTIPTTPASSTNPIIPATPVSCTSLSSQMQTLTCPTGQTGSITQTRTSTCNVGASTPTWSAWQTAANTCTAVNDIPTATTGWVEKIKSGDGTIIGWAADQNNPSSAITVNVYADASPGTKGSLIGSIKAAAVNMQVAWDKVAGNHGFSFKIPSSYFDGKSHTYSIEPIDALGRAGGLLGTGQPTATILSSANVPHSSFASADCLSPSSRCASYSNDYLAPNYPTASGWGDGVNYFDKWQCSSTNGINYIARLNIIPYGTHATTYQKDSLFVNWTDAYDAPGNPWLFFTSSSYDNGSVYSLKKVEYSSNEGRWKIYSVLDNPQSSGGVSSQDGRGTSFIMNDYSLPGWGPSSPIPGSQNKVPGVSNTSVGTQIPSYPLVGTGPLGITTITNALHPSTVSGGPEGRTCIHMNPKLFDYDAQGRPQSLIVNLWQNRTSEACPLPSGAPMAKLPAAGNYVYRYKGEALGWQLDLETGLVTDSISNDTTNAGMLVYKLIPGTTRSFITSTWGGLVLQMDLDKPKTANATKLLDCSGSGVHFGEATGRAENIFMLANPSDKPLELSPNVFYADIYYAFKN